MPIKSVMKKITLASLLVATTVLAQTPYDEGQKALREQQWLIAAEQFEQAIKSDREQADAAMYWRAYAFYKAGRSKEAERELNRLGRKYPQSSWVNEGQALRIEYQDPEISVAQIASGDTPMDEELQLFALSQLMDRSPERALPLVLDLAHNAQSASVRQDAIFVLAVNDAPQAREALLELASNGDDPDIQRNAIQILGTMDATEELKSLYAVTQDRDTKVALIESLSIAGESAMLKEVLASESDPELRRAAIYGIALEDNEESGDLLEALYAGTDSIEEKTTILEAFSMMDDGAAMASKILRTETDPQLQKAAIQVLGILDETAELDELYASMTSREARIAVLEAMSIAHDSSGLYQVLQSEKDAVLRTTAIQGLAINGGAEATDYILTLYPVGTREDKMAVVQAMMILDNTEGLLNLMKQETDPQLKREMLQILTIMGSEESDEMLFEMLQNKG